MAKLSFFIGSVIISVLLTHPVMADVSSKSSPWKRFSFNVGVFTSVADTDIKIGSGVGVSVDVEEALGLETDNTVFRVETYWRFTNNKRHRLDLSWFSFNRTGQKKITDDITVSRPEGEEIDHHHLQLQQTQAPRGDKWCGAQRGATVAAPPID